MDTRTQIEEMLKLRLGLQAPEFYLEILPTGSVSGSIVSNSFAGMDHLERQHRIWDVLDAELGTEATEKAGTLLAYTKAEWDVPLEGDPAFAKKQRKAK